MTNYLKTERKADRYSVFMAADTDRTARQIINTYEQHPEIEEGFQQIQYFWKILAKI